MNEKKYIWILGNEYIKLEILYFDTIQMTGTTMYTTQFKFKYD